MLLCGRCHGASDVQAGSSIAPPHSTRGLYLQQHSDWMVKRRAWLAKIQGIGAEKWDLQARAARMGADGGGHQGEAEAAALLAALFGGAGLGL